MAATLTKPIIVPQYGNGVIDLYTSPPVIGAPTLASSFTVNVTQIVDALFPGQGRITAPNAVALHRNDLFFTNSSNNSQVVFELPDYLQNPTARISHAFVVTLDGNDYTGVAFNAAGHLFTAEGNFDDNQIVEYTLPATAPTGAVAATDNYTAKTVIGNAGATSYFGDLAFDSGGNLWVADYENSRVVAFYATNLGGTDSWHSVTDAGGSQTVANSTTELTGSTVTKTACRAEEAAHRTRQLPVAAHGRRIIRPPSAGGSCHALGPQHSLD